MTTLRLALLAAAVACGLASDVVTLTMDNFEDKTKALTGDGGDWLVEFYAPWCGHCKKLQPIWEELATELKGDVNVGKVDVTENRALGSRFNIQGFPTIKFFHNGEVYPYKGPRSVDGFKTYAKGGYADLDGEKAPEQPSWSEITMRSITDPFKKAMQDVQKGKYLTPNTIVVAMPALAVFMIIVVMAILPDGDLEEKKKE